MPGHVNQDGVTIYAPSAPPGSGPGGAITLQDAYEAGETLTIDAAQGTIAISVTDTTQPLSISQPLGANPSISISRGSSVGPQLRMTRTSAEFGGVTASSDISTEGWTYYGSITLFGSDQTVINQAGSAFATQSGKGGTSASAAAAGAGGGLTLTGGVGGASSSTGAGGAGADIAITAGAGGNSTGGTGGRGGRVTITAGAVGTGGTPAAGYVKLASNTRMPTGVQLDLYNTADETTNYERLSILWTSNIARIIAEKAAGGTERQLQLLAGSGATGLTLEGASGGFATWIGTSGGAFIHGLNGDPAGFQFRSRITTGTTSGHLFINAPSGTGFSASSGSQTAFEIAPDINQSGTAAYNGLFVNITETTVGSGAKRPFRIDVTAVGTPAFCILNSGQLQALVGGVSAPVYSFLAETNAGLYRAAAGDIRLAAAGVDRIGVLAPAADETTALFIQVQDTGGGLSFVRVTCGADGSGGGATKLLRVPN